MLDALEGLDDLGGFGCVVCETEAVESSSQKVFAPKAQGHFEPGAGSQELRRSHGPRALKARFKLETPGVDDESTTGFRLHDCALAGDPAM